jgi:hypothetical protein
MEPTTMIRPNDGVAYQELAEGSGVLLHLETAQYHGVNPIGALVWALLGEGTTFGVLMRSLSERVEDPPPELDRDIEAFLEDLRVRHLVTFEGGGDDG